MSPSQGQPSNPERHGGEPSANEVAGSLGSTATRGAKDPSPKEWSDEEKDSWSRQVSIDTTSFEKQESDCEKLAGELFEILTERRKYCEEKGFKPARPFMLKRDEWGFLDGGNTESLNKKIRDIVDSGDDDKKVIKNLEELNKNILNEIGRLSESVEDKEKTDEAEDSFREASKGAKRKVTEHQYESLKIALSKDVDFEEGDAMPNAAAYGFVRGETIILTAKILELREKDADGSVNTNVLSLEWARQGKYGASFRYVLRAILGRMLIATGSQNEKQAAVTFMMDFLEQSSGYSLYPGMDKSTAQADVSACLLWSNNKDVMGMFSCGAFQSNALKGNAYAREPVRSHADYVAQSVKDIMFSREVARNSVRIPQSDGRGGIKEVEPEYAMNYSELDESGRSMLDIMVEWINSVRSGRAMNPIQKLDGQYLDRLINSIRVFHEIMRLRPSDEVLFETPENERTDEQRKQCEEYEHGLAMLRLAGDGNNKASLRARDDAAHEVARQMAAMFRTHNNINIRNVITGSTNGEILNFWLAKAGGVLHELDQKYLPGDGVRVESETEDGKREENSYVQDYMGDWVGEITKVLRRGDRSKMSTEDRAEFMRRVAEAKIWAERKTRELEKLEDELEEKLKEREERGERVALREEDQSSLEKAQKDEVIARAFLDSFNEFIPKNTREKMQIEMQEALGE